MADIITRLLIDDRQAISALNNYDRVLKGIENSYEEVERQSEATFKAPVDDVERLQREVKQLTAQVGKLKAEQSGAANSAAGMNDQLRAGTEAAEAFGGPLGELAGRGRALQDAFKGARGGVAGFRTALRGLKGALIATGIGAFVVIVGELVSAFVESGKAAKVLDTALVRVGIRSKESIQRISALKGALDGLAAASRTQLELEDRIAIAVLQAQGQQEQAILRRITAANRSLEIAQKNFDAARDAGEQALKNADSDRERNKIQEALNENSEQFLAIQQDLQGQIKAALDELAIFNAVQGVSTETTEENTTATEKNTEAVDDQVKAYKERNDEYRAYVKAREEAEARIEQSDRDAITRERERQTAERDRLLGPPPSDDPPEFVKESGEQDGEEYANAFAKGVGGVLTERAALEDVLNSFTDLFTQGTERRIEAVDAEIAKIQERQEALQTALADEQALQDEGLANRVDQLQQELDAEIAAETAAQAEREQLEQKKQALAKQADAAAAVLDLAEQARSLSAQTRNLAESGTELAKQGSKFPFPANLAIIAGSLAALFAFVARIRALAKPVALSEGGFIGQPGTSWRTDKGNRGHRVEGSNVVLGGDEYVINGRTTQLQRNFLDDLNAGLYDSVDLAGTLRDGLRKNDDTLNKYRSRRAQAQLNEAMAQAMQPLKKHLGQGQFYVYKPGDTVVHITPDKVIKTKMN